MILNPERVKSIIRSGADVVVIARDYKLENLKTFARIAADEGRKLTLKNASDMNPDSLMIIAKVGVGSVTIDLS